ncbi:hypothetical protein F4776DRAFT_653500 [Hypoxylon sp. NC0597]|nr:hypothetical protein F4776DRAFT_653500 [Hypoxylon sp. NC0597]
MKFQILIPATHFLLLNTHHALAEDPNAETNYIASVCTPPKAPDQSEPAPCIDARYIRVACEPNGTSPPALDAHAQCMCHGSYFASYMGCVSCLLFHGAISQRNFTYTSRVLSSASDMLCTGAPTAAFATLLSEVQTGVPQPTTGDAVLSDRKSGDAAVSLYYTTSGPQGPGVITGSATAAAATSGTLDLGILPPTAGPTSSNVAVPTGVAGGGRGALFAVAVVGGALVAVL